MEINKINIKKYNAKQLTVEIQPPQMSIEKEWNDRAKLPQEFETSIKFGTLKIEVYFKGNNRNEIIRNMGDFLQPFNKSVDIQLDGYKGKFKGFMTSNSYNKQKVKQRFILELNFDGYMYDEEIKHEFTGVKDISFYTKGTRDAPCIIEVKALAALSNFTISGIGDDDIIIESLAIGKSIIINGMTGTATIDGANAFSKLNMWEFPCLRVGETDISLSSALATVIVRYNPMLI